MQRITTPLRCFKPKRKTNCPNVARWASIIWPWRWRRFRSCSKFATSSALKEWKFFTKAGAGQGAIPASNFMIQTVIRSRSTPPWIKSAQMARAARLTSGNGRPLLKRPSRIRCRALNTIKRSNISNAVKSSITISPITANRADDGADHCDADHGKSGEIGNQRSVLVRAMLLRLRFRDFVLIVAQFLANFDDNSTIDFPFQILQAVVLLVVQKIGDIRVQAHEDILAILQICLLLLDRA